MTELHELTMTQAAEAILQRRMSSVGLTEALLARIDRLEPELRAWVTIDRAGALRQARDADAALAKGDRLGPIHGVPIGVKDIYLTAGLRTTAGFPPLEGYVPDRDATSVVKLRQAGAVVVGKTVTTQFATADPPPTRNPWRFDRTPGGSSSGSAAAVAARMVPMAMGSQTGGSILRPAAYCGVVGLKPTYGLVSRKDVMPLAWTLDHPGPICRTVEDAALTLTAIAGHDPGDPASSRGPAADYVAAARAPRAPKLGLLTDMLRRAEPEVGRHVAAIGDQLAAAGGSVQTVQLPAPFDLFFAVHRLTMQAEAAAVHLFGIADQRDQYAPRIRAEAMVGQLVPAPVYLHAQRLRRRLVEQTATLLAEYDALLLPTASNVAPAPDTTGDMSFQAIASLLGLPAISLPSGVSDDGVPFGLQLMAAPFSEPRLLQSASWCEQVLDFRGRPSFA